MLYYETSWKWQMKTETLSASCPWLKVNHIIFVFQKNADLENLIFCVISKCILRNKFANNFVTDLAKCLLEF